MQPTQQIRTLIHKFLEYNVLFANIPGSVSRFNIRRGVTNRSKGQALFKKLSRAIRQ